MSATASKNATVASELDLDAYRKRNETEREWQLRKLFIERFKDEFEHDRLLCMAQCYVNIKTLGCRYSDRIMNQIKSLTADFDPIVDERIEPIIKEMREKNPPQQNHSKQKQEKQAKNSPKPQQQQQQQQQQQNQPKQKLISKTQFVLGSPLKSTPQTTVNSNVAATVTNPVQILSRQQSQPQQIIQQSPKQSQPPQQQQQQQQPSTPNSKKLNQTTAVATSVQSQNLLGKSPAASSGVPVMTGSGEAAPNPALLPIPFGLQSSSSASMSGGGGKPAVRNVLLAQFSSSSSSSPANPLAILTAGVLGGATSVPPPPIVDDQNFRRLTRVNKLRDVLRAEQTQLQIDDSFDWSAYIEQKCASVGVNIAYNQFEYKAESTNSAYNPDGCALYYGELILESFRVTTNESKKRKKCKSGAYKHAYEILTSKSELGVKQVSAGNRRNALLVASVGKQQPLPVVDFDYELYSLDGSGDSAPRRIESVAKNLSTSLPPTTTTTTTTTATTTNVINNQELGNIDQMLKMILLKDNNKTAATASMDVTVEEKKTPNEADDDDDENRSQGSDKKSKIKQSLPNFIIFIPSSTLNSEEMTLANFDKFLHERNSINVLQNSCAKCKYAFELETKEKKAKSTSKDNGSNGKNNASVDQGESDEHDSQNNDGSRIKCKCLINGVKIATASAKNKNDAKRLAALKALKYLFKTFPVFKETSYQSIINNPANNNSTAAANDHAAETSKNALMASLGITPQSQPQTTPQYYKISKEDLFSGLIPPTMFENSSCGAAAVAVASSQQQLAQTNPSAASSSFGTN